MAAILFVVGLGLLIGIVLRRGFKTLPKEKWQMMAAFSLEKLEQGQWRGMNLTWYGLLSANAYTFGVIAAIAGGPQFDTADWVVFWGLILLMLANLIRTIRSGLIAEKQ